MNANKLNPLEVITNEVKPELDTINQMILDMARSHAHLIPEITKHITAAGGKRIRPILTLLVGRLLNIQNKGHYIKLATSVELIHTATLLHDDVIDESSLRRGVKTSNVIWGNKPSILVGDYLLSHAFYLMVGTESLDALSLLSKTSIKITESEIWQLDLIGKLNISLEDYIALIRGKTAELFGAACASPAHLEKDLKQYVDDLYDFGINMGILFQLIDDTLDYSSSQESLGKQIGADLEERKITLPLILLYQNASEGEKKLIASTLQEDVVNSQLIFKFIQKYDCIKKASEHCTYYYELCLKILENLPRNQHNFMLMNLLAFMLKRTY